MHVYKEGHSIWHLNNYVLIMQLKPINHVDNSGLFPYSMVSFSMIAGKTTIDGRLLWIVSKHQHHSNIRWPYLSGFEFKVNTLMYIYKYSVKMNTLKYKYIITTEENVLCFNQCSICTIALVNKCSHLLSYL